jgi:hypothetical protein
MAEKRVRGALSAGTRAFLALMPLAHAFPHPHWHQPAASRILGSKFALGQCCPLRQAGGRWTMGGAAFRRAGMRHGSRESACMSLDPLILVVHAAGVRLICFSRYLCLVTLFIRAALLFLFLFAAVLCTTCTCARRAQHSSKVTLYVRRSWCSLPLRPAHSPRWSVGVDSGRFDRERVAHSRCEGRGTFTYLYTHTHTHTGPC